MDSQIKMVSHVYGKFELHEDGYEPFDLMSDDTILSGPHHHLHNSPTAIRRGTKGVNTLRFLHTYKSRILVEMHRKNLKDQTDTANYSHVNHSLD